MSWVERGDRLKSVFLLLNSPPPLNDGFIFEFLVKTKCIFEIQFLPNMPDLTIMHFSFEEVPHADAGAWLNSSLGL